MQLPPDAFAPDPPLPSSLSASLADPLSNSTIHITADPHIDHGSDAHAHAGPSTSKTYTTAAPAGPAPIIRMCSVSHCKALLPAAHKYKRCEAHRMQNRMHSRIKRDREIERKTRGNRELMETLGGMANVSTGGEDDAAPEEHEGVGVGGWTLETGGHSGMGNRYIIGRASSATGEDGQGLEADTEPSIIPMTDVFPNEQLPQEYDEKGVPIPPAIRGARRTNYVCSVAKCFNLLSPRSPWKMCDGCRERDREVRGRVEKLRREGVEVCATRGCRELLRLKEIKGGMDKLRYGCLVTMMGV
jgi:hypothetical protein